MTHHYVRAMGLHALAQEVATGERPITGIRWYHPQPETHLPPTPVIPQAVHNVLCPSHAVNLEDPRGRVYVCDECKVAIENDEDAL